MAGYCLQKRGFPMKKAVKVFTIYLLSLLVCTIILSWFRLTTFSLSIGESSFLVKPIILFIIIGGVLSLRYTVTPKALRIFLLIYVILWIIRLVAIYVANQINLVTIFDKTYHFNIIINNYYDQVSRLATPLPFVIFWFINHFFSTGVLPASSKKQDTA